MKPIKNRFFCKDCGRIKMLFKTEKKAENFIKFNSEEIELETGVKPERSYFCIACNGWHVTHKKEILNIKSKTEIIEDLYNEEQERQIQIKAQKKAFEREQKALLILVWEMEQEALIHAQKVEDLKKSLDSVETYIATLENSKENKNKYIEMLDIAFEELENAKSIPVVFKKSEKRKKNAEEKLIMLIEKIKTQ